MPTSSSGRAACAFAAVRISETLALTWGDVDFTENMIHVRKGKTEASAQSVPMIPELVAEMQAQRRRALAAGFARGAADALVFVTATGNPQHRKNALRAVHAAGDAAGLNPEGERKSSSTTCGSRIPATDYKATRQAWIKDTFRRLGARDGLHSRLG